MHCLRHPVDALAPVEYAVGDDRERFLVDESDAAAEAEADARAETDLAEGRLIGHGAVRRWLASWGTGTRLPRPRAGD